jgi:hypothetical protein
MATPHHSSRRRGLGIERIALATLGAVGVLMATSGIAEAQVAAEPNPSWEFIVPAGRLIPTGDLRIAPR